MIAEIFRGSADIEEFKSRVLDLNGEFPLDRDEMVAIGNAYFDRYPDCFSNRDCREVTLGYKLVRICIAEKLLDHTDTGTLSLCRGMLHDISAIDANCRELVKSAGLERAVGIHRDMENRLKEVQAVIDSLPVGMIKERFVGGISNTYNVLYLIESCVRKLRQ